LGPSAGWEEAWGGSGLVQITIHMTCTFEVPVTSSSSLPLPSQPPAQHSVVEHCIFRPCGLSNAFPIPQINVALLIAGPVLSAKSPSGNQLPLCVATGRSSATPVQVSCIHQSHLMRSALSTVSRTSSPLRAVHHRRVASNDTGLRAPALSLPCRPVCTIASLHVLMPGGPQ
jgi:hypothetical protein